MKKLLIAFLVISGILAYLSFNVKKTVSTFSNFRVDMTINLLTEEEQKGVDEILDLYGGECSASKTFVVMNEEQINSVHLKINGSDMLEEMRDSSKVTTSNIAYLFYRNLEETKDNYSTVRVTISFEAGDSIEYEYTLEELKIIKEKEEVLNDVSNLLTNSDY